MSDLPGVSLASNSVPASTDRVSSRRHRDHQPRRRRQADVQGMEVSSSSVNDSTRPRPRPRPRQRPRSRPENFPHSDTLGIQGSMEWLACGDRTDAQECSICGYERDTFAVMPCSHRDVCAVCCIRMRFLQKETCCPICRADAFAVVLTPFYDLRYRFDDSDFHIVCDQAVTESVFYQGELSSLEDGKEYDDTSELERNGKTRRVAERMESLRIQSNLFAALNEMVFDPEWNVFVHGLRAHRNLRRLRHPQCCVCHQQASGSCSSTPTSCDLTTAEASSSQDPSSLRPTRFLNLRNYIRHTKSVHGREACRICEADSSMFFFELPLFSPPEMKKHLSLHPRCSICNDPKRFYSDYELHEHMTQSHFTCFLCDRDPAIRSNPTWYSNIERLTEHFFSAHFACPHPECMENHYIVFSSDLELQLHILDMHSENMKKWEKDQHRNRLLNMTFSPLEDTSVSSVSNSSQQPRRSAGSNRSKNRNSSLNNADAGGLTSMIRARAEAQNALDTSADRKGEKEVNGKNRSQNGEKRSSPVRPTQTSNISDRVLPEKESTSLRDELARDDSYPRFDSSAFSPGLSNEEYWPNLSSNDSNSTKSSSLSASPPSAASQNRWNRLFSEEKLRDLPPDKRAGISASQIVRKSVRKNIKEERARQLADAFGIPEDRFHELWLRNQTLYSIDALQAAQEDRMFVENAESKLINLFRSRDSKTLYFPSCSTRRRIIILDLARVFCMEANVVDQDAVLVRKSLRSVIPQLKLSEAPLTTMTREEYEERQRSSTVAILPSNPLTSPDGFEQVSIGDSSGGGSVVGYRAVGSITTSTLRDSSPTSHRGFVFSGSNEGAILTSAHVHTLFSQHRGSYRITPLRSQESYEYGFGGVTAGFLVVFASPDIKKKALESLSINTPFYLADCEIESDIIESFAAERARMTIEERMREDEESAVLDSWEDWKEVLSDS